MAVLVIYGMPEFQDASKLDQLAQELIQGITCSVDIDLKKEEVAVFFPRDLLLQGLGDELICLVEGLPASLVTLKPGVKHILAQETANLLALFASQHLPNCQRIDVLTREIKLENESFVTTNPQYSRKLRDK